MALEDPIVMPGSSADIQTELHAAVKNKNVKDVQRILRLPKVEVDCCDKDTMTPLMHAAYNGDEVMTELLLANGANADYQLHEDKV